MILSLSLVIAAAILLAGGSTGARVSAAEHDQPSATEPTQVPEASDAPDATDSPEATDAPEATDGPDATDAPQTTGAPEATDIPEATDAPQATDTPAATGAPGVSTGDINCDGHVTSADVLGLLEHVAHDDQPSIAQSTQCATPGTFVGNRIKGDLNCDGVVNVADVLDGLMIQASLSPALPADCTAP